MRGYSDARHDGNVAGEVLTLRRQFGQDYDGNAAGNMSMPVKSSTQGIRLLLGLHAHCARGLGETTHTILALDMDFADSSVRHDVENDLVGLDRAVFPLKGFLPDAESCSKFGDTEVGILAFGRAGENRFGPPRIVDLNQRISFPPVNKESELLCAGIDWS